MVALPSHPITLNTSISPFLEQCKVYDLLHSAVAILDGRCCILYENPAFSTFNLAVRDDAIQLRQLPSLLDCPDIQDWLNQCLQSGKNLTLKKTFYYSPRIKVDVTLCARLILTSNTDETGIFLTLGEESIDFDRSHIARSQESHRSLTERIKALDNDKRQNERLIRVLLKDAPFAMLLMNSKREIIQTNRAAEQLFGKTAAQLLGQPCQQVLSCYQKCGHCPAMATTLSIVAEEITGLKSDLQIIPLIRNAVVLDRDTEPLIIEAFIDLTEHKQTQETLNRLSEFNRLLVDSSGEGIFSVDVDLHCTFANQAAASILGYKSEDLIGQHIHTLFHSKQEDGNLLPIEDIPIYKVISSGLGMEANEVFWNRNGHAIPVQYQCNPIHESGSVSGAVVVFRNVSEARATAKKLDYLATHDALTGQLNRHAFEQRLANVIKHAYEDEFNHVLCYIDLDQFKIVNDTCGHAAGDELLRQLSEMIQNNLRRTDIFARLGGDEFGLLFANCPMEKAKVLAQELLSRISEYRFSWNNKLFSLGASIGMAELNRHIPDTSTAMSAVDAACYVAKERGRNRLHIYQANDLDLNQRHMEIEWVARIKTALNEDRFFLMAQSIVLVDQPHVQHQHMELLLRMYDEEGKIINPGSFIPAAERYGLMTEVDKWVVKEALKQLTLHPQYLQQIVHCCINLSGQSISDEKFLAFLLEQLAQHPAAAKHLCLEITETAAVTNLSHASQFMRSIKEKGCSFSLDDFGSGMSSFAYLKNLPVDFLKIDGNFVRDINHDKVDYAMVEAIHRVGNVMGIKTIAEFVENNLILGHLKDIGVDCAQGFGIHKPEPLDKFLSKTINPV
ncbi:EAL domain-containing protein [Sulfurirhabdus autotrophica]|uniref:PAS domain S-box-containing protein/diguanylate cyclase (GGDEF)-like protein n=1 Tax=Sulfurirhabdus autotrophica TaxID=1706046 RepID=A0A4R3Y6B1_9PROT|nr:EAL domain-containing protein [Sulfurirhabdus autotrophica]TCV87340.1 PAS domain S-box-containing protein/diguanylate cyclase (GGDEF)-like protein [Sulfurirhabdus autotrophica]